MTQTAPPAPLPAGYCGRCGAPFTAAGGAFCGRCGNPVAATPPAATGYSYPVAPPGTVPGMRHKLSRGRLWVIAAGAVAALVVVITVVVVLVRPMPVNCHFSCSRPQGAPLVGNTVYKNAQFGYSVEYLTGDVSVSASDSAGDTFSTTNGSTVRFIGSRGSDVDGAVQAAFATIDGNVYQDLQPVGPVRGAQIGFIPGHGTAYTGKFVPPNGGGKVPIAVMVMAASSNNVTIATVVISPYGNDASVQPYGLQEGQTLDYPMTLTHFPPPR
jgi:hypothetical protein